MKPPFALSLSIDGIALLHRGDGGWLLVGSVPVDATNLAEAMRGLLQRASGLEGSTRCKVIIPNDQIRYLAVETGTASEAERTEAVRGALATATPYPLSEIAFDTVRDGTITRIAAVARQTLDEAYGFAVEHGFEPVSYVAVPTPEDFPGEPFFGLSKLGERLSGAEAIEPDTLAVEIIGEIAPTKSKGKEIRGEDTGAEVETVPAAADAPDLPDTVTSPPPAPTTDAADRPGPAATEIHPIAEHMPPIAFASQRLPGTDGMDEAERLTIFGARNQAAARRGYLVPALAACVLVLAAVAGWLLLGPRDAPVAFDEDETRIVAETTPVQDRDEMVPPAAEAENPADTLSLTAEQTGEEEADLSSDLSPTDSAVLDALRIAPQTVEMVEEDPEGEQEMYAAADVDSEPPLAPQPPRAEALDDLYVASIDHAELSQDAVALPGVQEFATDAPLGQVSQPVPAGSRFMLDDRGLVAATAQGTLNPDGVMVYLGRPAKVPPPPPARVEAAPENDEAQERLAGLRPRPRPEKLVEQNERLNLGGRSREELAGVRPMVRPASLQKEPAVEEPPTALAAVRVPIPKPRPANIAVQVARVPSASNGTLAAALDSAGVEEADDEGESTAKTLAPKLPSSASVARQATMDNAINLKKVNLIGVYGTPANRRALIRLPNGRYKKVAVGDKIDGGKVVAIGDSELRFVKGGRSTTLTMPKG